MMEMQSTEQSAPEKSAAVDAHLWIPEPEPQELSSQQSASSSRHVQLLRDRLYVGNLSPAVDEYTLLQVFAKFGKVSKLDFLFHKSGPNKGKPRGYAFVEYMNEADAGKALESANGKLLRGRKLVVTFAQQAPLTNSGASSHGTKSKWADTSPTALSLVKSTGVGRTEAKTSSKIAMMEAKLRQMASSSPYAERPLLPQRPVPPAFTSDGPNGLSHQGEPLPHISIRRGKESQRLMVDTQLQSRTHIENDKAAPRLSSAPSSASTSKLQTESSEATRIPPSSKRSIPGVKIVKGRLKSIEQPGPKHGF